MLRHLCSPAAPSTKTFRELCNLLTGHYKPKRLEVADNYHFKEINQERSEYIASYSTRICRGPATCQFGEYLDRALRDQFISGLRHKSINKKLLDKNRTVFDCINLSLAKEAAVHSVQPAVRCKLSPHKESYSSQTHSSKPR